MRAAHSLVDTSPMIIISNSQDVESSSPNDKVLSMFGFDDYLWSIVNNCRYDSYIFVTHANVTDGDVNKKNMPFLMHAVDNARFSLPFPSHPNDQYIRKSSEKAIKYVKDHCQAEFVVANTSSATPIAPLTKNKPRVITADFAPHSAFSEVDESLRKIVGHLPSGNFLLVYNTTARRQARGSERPLITGNQASTEQIPYVSLFRNYQFFSPAIFMGLIVAGLLLFIFILAFNSVNSLQISSAAFEPRRQPPSRKQQ